MERKHHDTIKMKIKGYGEVSIDVEAAPMVELFNKIGLETKHSCQGTPGTSDNFYIMFADRIKDKDIEKFLNELSDGKDYTPLVGKMVKWGRLVDGSIKYNWMHLNEYDFTYKDDYETIKEQFDNKGKFWCINVRYSYVGDIVKGLSDDSFKQWIIKEANAPYKKKKITEDKEQEIRRRLKERL